MRSTPAVAGGRQLFLARDTEQYHVCLSAPGLPRDDDRRFALALLDHVLGGAASSRLVQEIREQRGMAYSVYSYTSSYDDAGQIGIYVGTRAENVAECVEIARARSPICAPAVSRPTSSSAPRRASRGACCSRSSRPRRACRGSAAPSSSGSEILSLDEVAARVDAVSTRTSPRSRPSCSRRSASRSRASGPTTTASRTAVGGEVALLEAVA